MWPCTAVGSAWAMLCRAAVKHSGDLTIIATGPLTNLALALEEDADLPAKGTLLALSCLEAYEMLLWSWTVLNCHDFLETSVRQIVAICTQKQIWPVQLQGFYICWCAQQTLLVLFCVQPRLKDWQMKLPSAQLLWHWLQNLRGDLPLLFDLVVELQKQATPQDLQLSSQNSSWMETYICQSLRVLAQPSFANSMKKRNRMISLKKVNLADLRSCIPGACRLCMSYVCAWPSPCLLTWSRLGAVAKLSIGSVSRMPAGCWMKESVKPSICNKSRAQNSMWSW